MTNLEATWRYRRDIAAAITAYNARYRKVWAAFGSPMPIPHGSECAAAMVNTWGHCQVAFTLAGHRLDTARAALDLGISGGIHAT